MKKNVCALEINTHLDCSLASIWFFRKWIDQEGQEQSEANLYHPHGKSLIRWTKVIQRAQRKAANQIAKGR